jgi:phosphinothricin acetyltransferase
MSSTHPVSVSVRLATEQDLGAINDIYNHYVLHSTCTYQEEPEPMSGRVHWFGRHGASHPVTVAVRDGQILGWGSLSAYHARSAYRYTVENSVYVHPEARRRGVGSVLLRDLIARAKDCGHQCIIAAIDADQEASVLLHAKWGFQEAGRLRRVGFKFGRWLDVAYMQLMLNEKA